MPEQHPTTLVIFGASGDLTERKLIPALYNLFRKERLSPEVKIVGASRTEFSDQAFRDHLENGLKEYSAGTFQPEIWKTFSRRIHYTPTDLTRSEDYHQLDKLLSSLEESPSNRIYYLAISPQFYQQTVEELGKAGMAAEKESSTGPWRPGRR